MKEESARKNIRNFIVISILLGTFYIAVIVGSQKSSNVQKVYLEKGFISVDETLQKNELLRLDGEWEIYPNQLLIPEDFKGNDKADYVELPTNLEKIDPQYRYSYGTVRGTVLLNDLENIYALKVQCFGTAAKVFVDGKVRKTVGKVGTSKEDYAFYVSPEAMSFKPTEKEVEIIIQYANFQYNRLKLKPLYFGRQEAIQKLHYTSIIRESILFGVMIVVGIFSLLFCLASKTDNSFAYLGVVSLTLAVRLGVLGERILVRTFSMLNGEMLVKLGFLPSFLFTPLMLLYVIELFELKWHKFRRILLGYTAGITILVILTKAWVYDPFMKYSFVIFPVVGLVVLVLLHRKLKLDASRKFTVNVGFILLISGGVNDYLREFAYMPVPGLLSYAFVVFLGMQVFSIVWKGNREYEKTKRLVMENEKMVHSIKIMNEDLERRIQERTILLKQSNEKLVALTNTDALTSLLNRRGFDEELNKLWTKGAKEIQPVCIFLIDVDDFKAFNDYYGHLEGDKCLKNIAEELKNFGKATRGITCRFGGEEFALLYYGQERAEVFINAKVLCQAIENMKVKNAPKAKHSTVTVSVGANIQVPKVNEDYQSFIEQADVALYNAKKNGKNQVHLS